MFVKRAIPIGNSSLPSPLTPIHDRIIAFSSPAPTRTLTCLTTVTLPLVLLLLSGVAGTARTSSGGSKRPDARIDRSNVCRILIVE